MKPNVKDANNINETPWNATKLFDIKYFTKLNISGYAHYFDQLLINYSEFEKYGLNFNAIFFEDIVQSLGSVICNACLIEKALLTCY